MATQKKDTKYILAIDHGTSGIKATLISVYGELAGYENQETPMTFLPNGGAEQDAEGWWQAFIEASQRLIQRKLVPTEDIVAVCCSSTFSSTVAVDVENVLWRKTLDNSSRLTFPGFPSPVWHNLR